MTVEQERHKRIKRRQKEFFNSTSFPEMGKLLARNFKDDLQKLAEEFKDYSQRDRKFFLEHGDLEYLFQFDSEAKIDAWKVSTDAGYEIGNTEASFSLTEQKTGLFKGFLRSDFDKPEKTKATYTGYANITSKPNYKAFYRKKLMDLTDYTHFRLKIRGDGRNYMLLIKNDSHFQETQTYLVMHPIYTHGGPYWQELRIPFGKFFQVSHGRISDRQFRFNADDVASLGVTCMDGVEGPFSLEFESISVYKDNQMMEELAYETYKVPKYIANT